MGRENVPEQDRTITAEELCGDCPEHLKEVSRRIEVLEAILPSAPMQIPQREKPAVVLRC
jgi:hypothetical protein